MRVMIQHITSGEVRVYDDVAGATSDWLHESDRDAPLEDYHCESPVTVIGVRSRNEDDPEIEVMDMADYRIIR